MRLSQRPVPDMREYMTGHKDEIESETSFGFERI